MTEYSMPPNDVEILIAEDSATQAAQLQLLLEAHGFHVTVAGNGREALRAALAHPPTLVITDIVMPEMDGYDLCAAIKADATLKDTPVVMVTSLAGIQDIARSLECGADNFIRKPYDPRTLIARIEYILLNLELRKGGRVQLGMEVYLGGRKHFITSGREQIVDLLISTYEEAVQMNRELQQQQEEIALSNRTLRTLYRIAGELNRVSSEAEVAGLALRHVLELPDFSGGWVYLDDGKGGLRTAAACALPEVLQMEGALDGECRCQVMLRAGELRHGAAVVECQRLQGRGEAGQGLHAHISVQLAVGSQPLGVMNVLGRPGAAVGAEELRLLEAVGSQMAVAIQRAQLYRHLESLVEQRTAALRAEIVERTRAEQGVASLNRIYAVLSGINTTIVRVHDQATLFDEACRIAVRLGKFCLAWIGLAEPDGPRLRPVAWMCEHKDMPESEFTFTEDDGVDARQGMFGRVMCERTAVICNDLALANDVFPVHAIERGCRSMAALPLVLDDRSLGAMALYAPEEDVFDEMELALLKEMAGDISFALDYIRKGEQLDYLAYYDALTGLPNRSLIHERLSQLLQVARHDAAEGGFVALLLVNIERFKNINDACGRHAGDALLKLVAHRLGQALGRTDRIGRIGNDHFAAILADLDDMAAVAHLLEDRILGVLAAPFRLEGRELHVPFKFGLALFPSDGTDADTLFANAETALRKAAVSQVRYAFYAPVMNARIAEQLTLENKLHRALEHGQFILHYQPKLALAGGAVVGLEALIRWNDAEDGLVSPQDFIPILEETGMIVDVGRWALGQALADHAGWQSAGLHPPRVAVNVSAVQLRRAEFQTELEQMLARYGGGPRLDLELTESLLMEDVEANVRRLDAVRDMGVRVAVDDFGTGYSSLSYLKRFPLDSLKIDQSFVRDITTDPDAAAICVAVIGLAHNLRLTVIAEGVETEDQMDYLREHGCDEFQGYLFSRPLPADELARVLRERNSAAPGYGASQWRG